MHMPGHKGKDMLGFEKYDITEVDGADALYHASGIIKESEENDYGKDSKMERNGFGCYACREPAVGL